MQFQFKNYKHLNLFIERTQKFQYYSKFGCFDADNHPSDDSVSLLNEESDPHIYESLINQGETLADIQQDIDTYLMEIIKSEFQKYQSQSQEKFLAEKPQARKLAVQVEVSQL